MKKETHLKIIIIIIREISLNDDDKEKGVWGEKLNILNNVPQDHEVEAENRVSPTQQETCPRECKGVENVPIGTSD